MGSLATPYLQVVTYFYNFGTHSISRERFELENLSLARILITRGSYEKKWKLGQWVS